MRKITIFLFQVLLHNFIIAFLSAFRMLNFRLKLVLNLWVFVLNTQGKERPKISYLQYYWKSALFCEHKSVLVCWYWRSIFISLSLHSFRTVRKNIPIKSISYAQTSWLKYLHVSSKVSEANLIVECLRVIYKLHSWIIWIFKTIFILPY